MTQNYFSRNQEKMFWGSVEYIYTHTLYIYIYITIALLMHV